jgi:hypothetical protein
LIRSPSQISLVGRLRSVVIYATKDKWANYKTLDVLQIPRDSTLEGLVRYVGVPSELRSRVRMVINFAHILVKARRPNMEPETQYRSRN